MVFLVSEALIRRKKNFYFFFFQFNLTSIQNIHSINPIESFVTKALRAVEERVLIRPNSCISFLCLFPIFDFVLSLLEKTTNHIHNHNINNSDSIIDRIEDNPSSNDFDI